MSTITYTRRTPVAVRAAQLLSVLLAVPMAIGSVMFSVITPDHRYAAWVTWLFSPIAFSAALGLLITAPGLVRHESARPRMLRLLAVVQAFSLVKLVVFHEVEAIPFLVAAVVSFALLRGRRLSPEGHPQG